MTVASKRPRATLEEVLDFANKVRKAGGGNPLDALMPAVPEDESQCLIAKNLNFNCRVEGSTADVREKSEQDAPWSMYVEDGDVAQRIADAIGTEANPPTYVEYDWEIELPERIGNVASAFDYAKSVAILLRRKSEGRAQYANVSDEDIALVNEMWPFIAESVKEAHELASIVNEDGSIVL
jgi:hypothetical protein